MAGWRQFNRNCRDLAPEMLLTGPAQAKTPEWARHYAGSRYRRQFVEDREAQAAPPSAEAPRASRRAIDVRQWLTLTRRRLILKLRDRAQLVILLLQAPLFGALIGLVYGAVKNPAPPGAGPPAAGDIRAFAELGANLTGIHFLMVAAAIWFGCNNAARDIVGEWTIYQRERMVNLKLLSYVGSKLAIMIGLCVLQCLTLLGLVYWWTDLNLPCSWRQSCLSSKCAISIDRRASRAVYSRRPRPQIQAGL